MAVRTYRLGSGQDGNYGALFEADQTAATRTDGWTSAKIATGYQADFDAATKLSSGAFALSAKPASFLTGTTANAFKTPAALIGTFAATAWTFSFAVRAGTASAQAGRIRLRVFKSKNADGSAATELTGATQVGTTTAALSTSADQVSTVTWSPGATVRLNNEFLFFVIAWEITTVGGSNSCDVLFRTGQAAAGTRVVTPDFVANAQLFGVVAMPITVKFAIAGQIVEINPPPVKDYKGRWDAFDSSSFKMWTTDTTRVQEWSDKGAFNHLMQGSDGSAPNLAQSINGKPCPTFSGTPYPQAVQVRGGLPPAAPNFTLLVVAKRNADGGTGPIWGGDRTGHALGFEQGDFLTVYNTYYGPNIVQHPVKPAVGIPFIATVVWSDPNCTLRKDGVSVKGSTPGMGYSDSTWTTIGNDWAGQLEGTVAEVIYFDRTLSTTEIASMEAWLATKWNTPPLPRYPAAVLADNPIYYSRLGESSGTTALNEVGENGTYVGSPALAQVGALAGDSDTSVLFDGSNDQVTLPTSVTVPPASSITVEFWNYVATADVKPSMAFTIGPPGGGANDRASAHVPYSDKVLYWDYGNVSYARVTTDYTPYLDKWTHVVLTYDVATGKHAITLNGVEVASTTIGVDPDTTLLGGIIGSDGSSSFHKGRIDEFAIYNIALSPARRLAHYLAGKPLPVTHYGSSSMAIAFTADTQAQRKTFGKLLSPFLFSKDIRGQRKTFGQTAFPINISIVTAGIVRAAMVFGASSMSVIFGKDVRGQRKTFSQMAFPVTFAKDVVGQRRTFGQVVFPIIFTKEAVGRRSVFGQLTMQTLFGKEVTGRRKTFGQFVFPITFLKDIRGRKQTFGQIVRPINVTIVVNGNVRHNLYGSLVMPLAFSKQVIAYRKTFGKTASPFIFGSIFQGQRRTVSQVVFPLNFAVDVKTGHIGVHGQISFPIVISFETIGTKIRGAIILNEAQALYLGDTDVSAVYVGSEKVWP